MKAALEKVERIIIILDSLSFTDDRDKELWLQRDQIVDEMHGTHFTDPRLLLVKLRHLLNYHKTASSSDPQYRLSQRIQSAIKNEHDIDGLDLFKDLDVDG